MVEFCREAKEATDLFRISGEFNYLIKIQTASVEEIAELQDSLVKLGHSKSHICMKNILENRVLL
ncbi:Lrp/AsnC ligand binding domain-containing protein [Paenibacillus sp. MZ03-122A]|uniref:Lrp/AsnC ligand binding domain-containing protein n=1 Tax=Paenibacillus sp. MZ03-122A TaxID=2962033 RepID=UPI0020B73B95|nr:Lrp/AsnC ligand binding domain-containing protein [Paenibacillus sp. MZ03-122A]MCP3777993.1 Lrp/AsnC ligand binding domain-containing protein [Paenibacillus sp. MZ03-122A]